jgi:purine-nucleoside phosphorylase
LFKEDDEVNTTNPTLETIHAAADYIRRQTTLQPTIAMILGSGMGPLADEIEADAVIPYETSPHFPQSGVAGHAGRMLIGRLAGQTVLVMQGRVHYYEGYSMALVTLPVRIMQALGIEMLIVTNAAGGLNPDFRAGDLMLITDHINLTGMAGHNPLRGPNLDEFGVRFPSMVTPYDLDLQAVAREAASEAGVELREGIYINLAGPAFETPAEVRFLRLIGGDAVGMSTAPEVVVARHGGMRVLGVSGISNVAVTDPTSGLNTTHEEVLAGSQVLAPKLIALVRQILMKIG